MTSLNTKYLAEKEHFISQFDKCWDPECRGTLKILEQPEPFTDQGTEHLRVVKCTVCEKGYSFWSYKQWLKNKRASAHRILKDARENRKQAQEEAQKALEDVKTQYQAKLAEISRKTAEAKVTLLELKEERSSQHEMATVGAGGL
jgi:hypothetical protein